MVSFVNFLQRFLTDFSCCTHTMARMSRRRSIFSKCPNPGDFQFRRIHYPALVMILGIGTSILLILYQVSVVYQERATTEVTESVPSDYRDPMMMHIHSKSFQEVRDRVIAAQNPNGIELTTTPRPSHSPTVPTFPPTHHPSTPDTTATTKPPTKSPVTPKPTKSPTHKPTESPTTDNPTTDETLIVDSLSSLSRSGSSDIAPQHDDHHDHWIVDWELAASPYNLTSTNVSHAVRWKNSHYNGSCDIQLHPILTNASGFEYLWVHDLMSIEGGTKVWIFAVDPSAIFQRDLEPPIWLGLYNSYLICAFNDGTTVISEEIKFMRRKNLDFIVVICPIPPRLTKLVLQSTEWTWIGVTLFDSRNRSLNMLYGLEWKNVTLPVCSTLVVDRGKHIARIDGGVYEDVYNAEDPVAVKKHHKLSACLILHPSGDK